MTLIINICKKFCLIQKQTLLHLRVTEEEEESHPFSAELASWAIESLCTRANLNKLLVLFGKGLPLPKDAHTLLQNTLNCRDVRKMWWSVVFGVEIGILKIISRNTKYR
jgi:hypothetical protein